MTTYRRNTQGLAAAALIIAGTASTGWAGEPRSEVIGEADIQMQIDARVGQEAADRQAVLELLRRPEVRKIAGATGLDIRRASAAVGTLSGSQLRDIAARVNEINGGIGGGQTVTISVTAIIIILLLLIILAN